MILFVVAFPIQGCENIPSKQEIERLTKAIEQLGGEAEQLRGEIKQLRSEVEQLRSAAKPLTDTMAAFQKDFGKSSPNEAANLAAQMDLQSAETAMKLYKLHHAKYTMNLKDLEKEGFRPRNGVIVEILEATKDHYRMQAYHKDGDEVIFTTERGGSIESRPKKGE